MVRVPYPVPRTPYTHTHTPYCPVTGYQYLQNNHIINAPLLVPVSGPYSTPINPLRIFLNKSPCSGLVSASASMSSVPKCSTTTSPASMRSLTKKNLMAM